MTERRVAVFVCGCGGNISDHVDVERVRDSIQDEPGVVVAKTHMFTCSDAAQQEMIDDIRHHDIDGLVIASCSPKLHLFTFRGMAERAGLNPYQYVQVNIREQCSWVHQGDVEKATEKAIRLVHAGIARARLSEPLTPQRIDTVPGVLVIGAGVAGLRASLAVSDLGLSVFLVERAEQVGGWTAKWGKMFLHDEEGSAIISDLLRQVNERENITLFTRSEIVEKNGTIGDFLVKLRVPTGDTLSLRVGAILVATGFDAYEPKDGEFGWGQEGVIRLPEFKELVARAGSELIHRGRRVRDIVYIYCVGSRQEEGEHPYCSRYCCNAATHEAVCAYEKDPSLHQFQLFRDMRTYGKHETLYEKASQAHCVFVRYADDEPPVVERQNGRLSVRVKDQLLGGEAIEIGADLVVLVTGMVPRKNEQLADVLKLPVGPDGFFNEIHPKLRPVETVVDGVFIVGTAQGPKTMAESVASALGGVAKSAALLMKGYVELEPFLAQVDPERCTWCGACLEACPYAAVEKTQTNGREVARVISSLCKGGGACVAVCPESAIELKGYTDGQISAMIGALAQEASACPT
ncbi:4Fe-4S ferredoxin [candidate division TA06 bacterium DG_24]|jgi:heterodisulfide reductase subunit A|uniref:4Fe-4S ferredoxin n=1 Tax=candidate division TA06 bacterium DG_24 TaxID=1703770 RepID=A0A0S7WP60_UNCT6|nr:MAG: 4Fe-4S ferredoxin [candidate division TA06 bacterium DG_24]